MAGKELALLAADDYDSMVANAKGAAMEICLAQCERDAPTLEELESVELTRGEKGGLLFCQTMWHMVTLFFVRFVSFMPIWVIMAIINYHLGNLTFQYFRRQDYLLKLFRKRWHGNKAKSRYISIYLGFLISDAWDLCFGDVGVLILAKKYLDSVLFDLKNAKEDRKVELQYAHDLAKYKAEVKSFLSQCTLQKRNIGTMIVELERVKITPDCASELKLVIADKVTEVRWRLEYLQEAVGKFRAFFEIAKSMSGGQNPHFEIVKDAFLELVTSVPPEFSQP